MWHKPCRTFHPWCLCIKTRCLVHYQTTWFIMRNMPARKISIWISLFRGTQSSNHSFNEQWAKNHIHPVLTQCSLVKPNWDIKQNCANIGSGNGLLPDGTKLLSECQAPRHNLNQSWLLISEVLWHSPESNFTVSAQGTIPCNEYENYTFKIVVTSAKSSNQS